MIKKTLYKIENILIKVFPQFSFFFGFVMFFIIKYTRSNYSQFGEDVAINQYFDNIKVINGNYIDIGAFHPNWISNTHILSKKNWKGIAIDLDPEKLRLFKIFRKNITTINKAVVSSKYNLNSINYFKFNRFFSEINTVDEVFANKKSLETGFTYKKSSLEVVNINELLNMVNNNLDFLNIDAEGIDEELILDIDFNKNKIRSICLESHSSSFKEGKLFKYLTKLGYILLYESKPAYCFIIKY